MNDYPRAPTSEPRSRIAALRSAAARPRRVAARLHRARRRRRSRLPARPRGDQQRFVARHARRILALRKRYYVAAALTHALRFGAIARILHGARAPPAPLLPASSCSP